MKSWMLTLYDKSERSTIPGHILKLQRPLNMKDVDFAS